jgi:ferredoxin
MVILQFLFILVTFAVFAVAGRQFYTIYRNINLGKPNFDGSDRVFDRLRSMTLVALGQQKMFARPLAAVLHLFIYVAFVITQVELLEIFIDGFFGTHRFFLPYLESYHIYWCIISFIEFLSVLAFVATVAFLSRRFYLKLPRFQNAELRGFPMFDAALILGLEIVLVTCIFTMNSTDLALQARGAEGFHHTGGFLVSQFIAPLWSGVPSGLLHFAERVGWWGHFLMVMTFIVYLPYSKHLHIFLAFFNTYYTRFEARGAMPNMPEVQREVALMFSDNPYASSEPAPEITKFGASDVFDLSWKNLLEAYTCTECGRCTSVCPANITGKQLSPRKIMMDVRDRLEEVGENLNNQNLEVVKAEFRLTSLVLTPENYDDGKSLFDRISAKNYAPVRLAMRVWRLALC